MYKSTDQLPAAGNPPIKAVWLQVWVPTQQQPTRPHSCDQLISLHAADWSNCAFARLVAPKHLQPHGPRWGPHRPPSSWGGGEGAFDRLHRGRATAAFLEVDKVLGAFYQQRAEVNTDRESCTPKAAGSSRHRPLILLFCQHGGTFERPDGGCDSVREVKRTFLLLFIR